jgi:hypothetical protein
MVRPLGQGFQAREPRTWWEGVARGGGSGALPGSGLFLELLIFRRILSLVLIKGSLK